MSEYEELKKMDEQIKNKAGKKPLLQRLKENRDSTRANKEHYKKLYREEFEKSKEKAIIKRAKQEAYEKYRPTRKQRIDSALSGFANLGIEAAGIGRPRPKKTKQSKTKYTNIGGKAYPIAGSGKTKSNSHKPKKKSKNPFDFDFVDDFGDFDF